MQIFKRRFPWPVYLIALLLLLALFRDLIANNRPLYCKVGGQNYYPAFRAYIESGKYIYRDTPILDSLDYNTLWHTLPPDHAVFALVPFTAGEKYHKTNEKQKPFSLGPAEHPVHRHWLGTSNSGLDIAACMVSGARVAIVTGLVTIGLAFVFGLFFGLIAGYYGDQRLRVTRGALIFGLLSLPFAWFYGFVAREYELAQGAWGSFAMSLLWFFALVALFVFLGKMLALAWPFFRQKVTLPADQMVMRLGELFTAVPKILLVIAFAAWRGPNHQSLLPLLALIGFMSWPVVTRFVRAELLKIRELDYVAIARAQGLSDLRIMLRHLLPNAWRPIGIALSMGVAGAIMLESSLSFLGYGKRSENEVSWGKLLAYVGDYSQNWWMALPPVFAITLTVYALYSLNESQSDMGQ